MGNLLYKLPYPATQAGSPGSPGSPYIPGHWEYSNTTTTVPNANTAPSGWTYVNITGTDTNPQSYAVPVPPTGTAAPAPGTYAGTQVQQPVAVWVPPQPAVAPVPPTDPVYPPNAWDAGARSIGMLPADGDFTCTVDNGVGGISIGFATTPSLDPKNITLGLYFHGGVVQAFENPPGGAPTILGASNAYAATDVWTVRRRLGVASLLKNGTTIYTAVNPVIGPQQIQASLWQPYDTTREAAITPRAGGSVAGSFRYLQGLLGKPQSAVQGSFLPLTATLTAKGHGSVAGSFRPLDAVVGKARQGVVNGSFRPLTALVSNGGFRPGATSRVIGEFLVPQAAIHGLTGGKGQVAGAFRPLDAMLGKARQGLVRGSFAPMTGQAYANPPGVVFLDSYAAVQDSMDVVTVLVANIDSTGVMTDAYVVQVTATGANLDSLGTGVWDWVIQQVDSVNIDSTAVMHDLMSMGVAVGDLTPGTAVWTLNLDSNASTRYENFPYTSLATHQGRLFGTKPDGVYLLEGADDAGTPIVASFATGKTNFASEKDPHQAGALKRIPAVYMAVASDQSMYLKVVANDQEFLYVARASSPTLMQQRVDTGKGLRANYYSFEVFNSQGADFDLDTLEFMPVKLPRRLP